ncbi:prenyltransferase [Calidifontibacter sp. DB0510]|uniref:Prenyltransferase n=1 Tax=Metallococcus carri TaxID=1656884 RepID=A0A967EHV2_9MICO|nr:prenyltransferase [Metallococcus carri]NHN57168.1 prenyltransferase [Metallococcus carri]NOP38029.1 prenyltransferase [Calidifontibacter sp. DB2511S]
MRVPALEGVLSVEQACATGDFIASQQSSDGAIPWYAGGRLDVWDHVESAMGLTVAGRIAEAEAAYGWLARTQRDDGSWPMRLQDGRVEDAAADTNQCAYVAVGVWHHHLVTGSVAHLARLWPTVERAINFVIRAQLPSGALGWAVDGNGVVPEALITGSSSALQAIDCAGEIGRVLGHDRPRWRAAARRLGAAVRSDHGFLDKTRYSMDWYYPVLAGAVRDEAAERRLASRWDTFVWPGRGIRCVADEPWVTAAETCELVLALEATGRHTSALELFEQVQFLRDGATGGYWTGMNIPLAEVYPEGEQTTWSAAAVLLAADALCDATGGAEIFRSAGAGQVVEDAAS